MKNTRTKMASFMSATRARIPCELFKGTIEFGEGKIVDSFYILFHSGHVETL